LGPGETAVVDLAAERTFGNRPALVPSNTATRLLLAVPNTTYAADFRDGQPVIGGGQQDSAE
jgi:hypothetical protein